MMISRRQWLLSKRPTKKPRSAELRGLVEGQGAYLLRALRVMKSVRLNTSANAPKEASTMVIYICSIWDIVALPL